jgi:hypothetical protein
MKKKSVGIKLGFKHIQQNKQKLYKGKPALLWLKLFQIKLGKLFHQVKLFLDKPMIILWAQQLSSLKMWVILKCIWKRCMQFLHLIWSKSQRNNVRLLENQGNKLRISFEPKMTSILFHLHKLFYISSKKLIIPYMFKKAPMIKFIVHKPLTTIHLALQSKSFHTRLTLHFFSP